MNEIQDKAASPSEKTSPPGEARQLVPGVTGVPSTLPPAAPSASNTSYPSPFSADREERRQKSQPSYALSLVDVPVVAHSRRADMIRQWILLVPLATAVLGVVGTQVDDVYVQQLLPALFFIGALLITVAMLHQRRLFQLTETLSDDLRSANAHLDLLHRLQFELNQSLDVSEVSRTVLEHALTSFGATSGALWLRPHDVSMRGDKRGRMTEERLWRLEASRGWPTNQRGSLLQCLGNALGEETSEIMHRVDDEPTVQTDFYNRVAGCDDKGMSAMGVPVSWKDEVIGYILVARGEGESQFNSGDAEMLREFGLITGPSLENALLYQRTLTRADIDGLTNLLNHRAVQERLSQELARTQRARRTSPEAQFSIAIFDLADFKLFNDTYGHATGDEILRTVARTLRSISRASDVVARYGGDEFLAILPEADETGAMVTCNRAIETLSSQPFVADDGSQIVIRITCGIAVYPSDGESGDDLFEAADARLYEAKQQGQQVISYVRVPPEDKEKPRERVVESASLWGNFGVLDALITAIDNRDHYTRRHSEQVMSYALLLARHLESSQEILEAVCTGALLYDIGKIAVPDAILRKPGLLSPDETRLMQQHCRFGAMMVQDVAHRDRVIECVLHHHEAWDGSGYPSGLIGEQIPWMGRLIAVADAFAAMTTDRPYRRALEPVNALGELQRNRAARFDPAMVDAFGEVLKEVIAGRATLAELQLEARAFAETLTAKHPVLTEH